LSKYDYFFLFVLRIPISDGLFLASLTDLEDQYAVRSGELLPVFQFYLIEEITQDPVAITYLENGILDPTTMFFQKLRKSGASPIRFEII
jgi:hypothetical protein